MEKKSAYRQVFLFLLIVMACLISYKVFYGNAYKGEAWYRVTLSYIEAFEKIGSTYSTNDEKQEAARAYLRAGAELQNTPAPSESTLLKLLNSNNPIENKIALILINQKNISSPLITEAAIRTNTTKDEMLKKIHLYNYLGKLENTQIKDNEALLFEMLNWERSKEGLAISIGLLGKIESEESISLLSALFVGENVDNFRAYIFTKLIGNSTTITALKKNLKDRNETAALDALIKLEQSINQ